MNSEFSERVKQTDAQSMMPRKPKRLMSLTRKTLAACLKRSMRSRTFCSFWSLSPSAACAGESALDRSECMGGGGVDGGLCAAEGVDGTEAVDSSFSKSSSSASLDVRGRRFREPLWLNGRWVHTSFIIRVWIHCDLIFWFIVSVIKVGISCDYAYYTFRRQLRLYCF